MSKKVLITGGTGLLGKELSNLLYSKGYEVSILSRSNKTDGKFQYYKWDIKNRFIEEGALDVDVIIHLAGAGIADQRWSPKRKKIILDSRIKSTALLESKIRELKGPKPMYIGASAIGIYGAQDQFPVTESDISEERDQFLVDVTHEWENAHEKIRAIVEHWAVIRIGIVLSTEGGALKPLLIPFLFRMGSYFGKGNQIMSWIHIADVARMIEYIVDKRISGTFNSVAPHPVSGKELVRTIAKVKKGPYILLGVPAFFLKIVFGEMSQAILMSTKVSSDNILSQGFTFRYGKIKEAIENLLTT